MYAVTKKLASCTHRSMLERVKRFAGAMPWQTTQFRLVLTHCEGCASASRLAIAGRSRRAGGLAMFHHRCNGLLRPRQLYARAAPQSALSSTPCDGTGLRAATERAPR